MFDVFLALRKKWNGINGISITDYLLEPCTQTSERKDESKFQIVFGSLRRALSSVGHRYISNLVHV